MPGATAGRMSDQGDRLLELGPVAVRALAQLPAWLGRPTADQAAAARLAFRDAEALGDGGGALLLRVLAGRLAEPWTVLRLIALMHGRSSDRFLAASELAWFGDKLLDDLEAQAAAVGGFDGEGGPGAGRAAADAVSRAAATIREFETFIELKRDGPWGPRVARAKRALAEAVEGRLTGLERAVSVAFPLRPERVAGRLVRSVPRLGADPDVDTVGRAEALATFAAETASTAVDGGFGSLRAKVLEGLRERLAHYVEDLVGIAHTGDVEAAARARRYLQAAAGLVGLVEGGKAAEVVRRRAAAA